MVEKVKYRNYNGLVVLRSNAKLLFTIKKCYTIVLFWRKDESKKKIRRYVN